MFGVIGSKKIGFLDISKLRWGTYKGFENNGNTQIIKYLPDGKISAKEILEVQPGSVHPAPAYEAGSRYSSMMVMYASERGESPFVNQYLGPKGKIVDLIRNMNAMEQYQRISRAASESALKNAARGDKSVLKSVVDNIKTVDEATQKQGYPFGRLRKRTSSSIY